ncbi:oligosaccharide flippase family protein [Runella sp.]|uniref:oligosaccharide flippase family protein n=1 Tax=Runella sp. TaxID=1960881 RepID=UPI003D0E1F54
MKKNRLLQNLSANTSQLLFNQLLGLVIFYLLSTGLDKFDFGQLNLALAIMQFSFNLLSLGIDQISIRKTASGENIQSLLSLYLYHVLLTGFLFFGLVFAGKYFISPEGGLYPLLIFIAFGRLMIYLSTPFKQLTIGLERFRILSLMLIITNFVRSFGLILLTALKVLSLQSTVIVFIAGDVLELAVCIYLFSRHTHIPIRISLNMGKYLQLLKESLPQTGVTILTSAIARFDWIFIGFIVSTVKLAEYSFAYKVFEMATFPLLAIAPLLIPRFTKMFTKDRVRINELVFLMRAEMVIAASTTLVLNILWAPIVDTITAGKYGSVNSNTIFLLSLCFPFLYLNNFYWTIYFAQGQMRMILKGFAITFIVNVGLDLVLIPFLGNEGAALAFLVTCAVQTFFYASQNKLTELNIVWYTILMSTGAAFVSGFIAKLFFTNHILVLVLALGIFLTLLLVTSQLKLSDRKSIRSLFIE